MITLIYGSTAKEKFADEELVELLKKAKIKNDAADLTGMLLYSNENFLQVLEGDEKDVMGLYEKIKQDPRHKSIDTIMKRSITERVFSDWSMGFVNLDIYEGQEVPGFTDYMMSVIEPEQFKEKPSAAYIFLKNFKNLMR